MTELRINLLKNRPTLSESEYQRERKILTWSVIGLVVVVVVVAALSAWNVVLAQRLSVIEADITQSAGEINNLTQASANQIYLKSRLKLITAYLADRTVIRESLQKVLTNEVPGTHVDGASFVSENVLRVQIVASSNQSLVDAVKYYSESNTFFTQVVSRGITRTKDGNYQLSLDLTVPKGGS